MGRKHLITYSLIAAMGLGSTSTALAWDFPKFIKNLLPGSAQKSAPKVESKVVTGTHAVPQRKMEEILYFKDDLQEKTSGVFKDIFERVRTGHYFSTQGRESVIDEAIELLNSMGRDIVSIEGSAGTGKSQVLVGLQERIQAGQVPNMLKNARIVEINGTSNILSDLSALESQFSTLANTLNSHEGMIIIAFSDVARFLTDEASKSQAFDSVIDLAQRKFGGKRVKFAVEGTPQQVQKLAATYSTAKGIASVKLPALSTFDATAIAIDIAKRMKAEFEFNISGENLVRAVQMADQHLGSIGMPKSLVMLLHGAKSRRELLITALESPLSAHLRTLNKDLELELSKLQNLEGAHAAKRKELLPKLIADNNQKIVEVDKSFKELKAAIAQLAAKRSEAAKYGNSRIPQQLQDDILALEAQINQVTEDEMALWISRETKIPVEKIMRKKMSLEEFKSFIDDNFFGQPEAAKMALQVAENSRGIYKTSDKPIHNVLLLGKPGTGKTEVVKLIARFLSDNLARWDMSEFAHSHQVSRLIGAPPGYLGFDKMEPGELIKALMASNEGAALFDEINLAHKDAENILYQLLSDGRVTGGTGQTAKASRWGVFATSNSGMDVLTPNMSREEKVEILVNQFGWNRAILDRFDEIIVMEDLNKSVFTQIAGKEIRKLQDEMVKDLRGLEVTPEALEELVRPVAEGKVTAREINRIVAEKVTAQANRARTGFWRDAFGKNHDIAFKDGDTLRLTFGQNRGLEFEIAPAVAAP